MENEKTALGMVVNENMLPLSQQAEIMKHRLAIADKFHKAGCFGGDVKNSFQAMVKIQAGAEMGMPPMGRGLSTQDPVDLTGPQFIGELSKHIATKQVKRGIGKAVELARPKEDITITNTISPPEEMEQPLNKAELQQIAQRLYDLGYYYEKNPESDEIEFTLAPNYTGLLRKATSKEKDRLQAAIKRFQRVHGFSPDKCDGCIRLE